MRNLKLTIQYDGARYKGWQKLGNDENTIQDKIEKTLSELLNEKIDLICSGRTDAKVNAENQVANFHTTSDISIDKILDHCYRSLPLDIIVKNIEEVDESFHSRFDVHEKVYTYKIDNAKFHDVFKRKYYYHVKEKLDIEKMKEASKIFIGSHDFRSFTALKAKKKSTKRKINYIDFKTNEDTIEIVFSGNGFLYRMVRILAGTIIDAGLSKITPDEIKEIMDAKKRSLAPETAPANALFLTKVVY